MDARSLTIEVAAQDSDMTALFEMRILGETTAIDDDRAARLEEYPDGQLDAETRAIYGLSRQDLTKAKARCIARVAGVCIGEDFFHGQA